jgi:hypothetical protein
VEGVIVWAELEELLMTAGLPWNQWIECRQMYIGSENRVVNAFFVAYTARKISWLSEDGGY